MLLYPRSKLMAFVVIGLVFGCDAESKEGRAPVAVPGEDAGDAEMDAGIDDEPGDASVPMQPADAGPGATSDAGMDAGMAPVVRRPDLQLEVADPQRSISFRKQTVSSDSCEFVDGCAMDTGERTLMDVEFTLRNSGLGSLEIGSPTGSSLFRSSACNRRFIQGLFGAELRDSSRRLVARGSMSTSCLDSGSGRYTCRTQGLEVDGASIQPQGACNFLDVTDVPGGDYSLRVTVNADRRIEESNFDNNSLEWPIRLQERQMMSCDHIACGSACCPVGASCDHGECVLPDLRVNYEAAADPAKLQIVERAFGVDSCEVEEACVGGSGVRILLLFEGRLENHGPGDLDLGAQENNPLFQYSSCHGHYHTENFARYALRNLDGSIAAEGHKQGYCLSDMSEINDWSAPTTRPPMGRGTPCSRLSAGWADVYDNETACQWIDITGVPSGEYLLEVTINPTGHIAEITTSNNTIRVPVTIPESGEGDPTGL